MRAGGAIAYNAPAMDIEDLEKLAALKLDGDERHQLREDLQRLQQSIDRLRKLDTTDVDPALKPVQPPAVERDDQPAEPLPVERALENAPCRRRDHVSVPAVLSSDDDTN